VTIDESVEILKRLVAAASPARAPAAQKPVLRAVS
jgi:hypothetical protein